MLCIGCNVDQEGLHDVGVSPCLGWSGWVAIGPSYVRHGDSIVRRGHEGRALVSGEPNLYAANTRGRGPRVRRGWPGANEKMKARTIKSFTRSPFSPIGATERSPATQVEDH